MPKATLDDLANMFIYMNNHSAFIWDKKQSLWRSVNYDDRNVEVQVKPHGFDVFLYLDCDEEPIDLTATVFNVHMLQSFIETKLITP